MSQPDADPDSHRLDAQLLADLWIFRAAARCGSFTAAAGRLGVTQGAVSQRVLRLEARLGISLFVRRKGRMSLSDAGVAMLEAMNDVSLRVSDTLSRFDRIQRRSIVVSCVPSLATEWLVPRLGDFYASHPHVELFVRAELTSTSAERMEDDGIDVLIQYQEAPVPDLHELAAVREMIIPVCSRSYRARMLDGSLEGIVRLHDDVPWLGGPDNFEWNAWLAAQPDWPFRTTGDRHFNLAHLAYHAAMEDQGVAIGRTVLVNRLLRRGELVPATDAAPVEGAMYRILVLRPGSRQSQIRSFAAWVSRTLSQTHVETLELVRAAADERTEL